MSIAMPVRGQDRNHLSNAVIRLQAGVLALVCGTIGGLGLFIMTVWLLVKGGANVGAHLNLLGQYFIGYSVSWEGSFVGLLYGALVGGVVGWTIGKVYNAVTRVRQH